MRALLQPIALLLLLAFGGLHTAALAAGPERCSRCPDLVGASPCQEETCDHHEDAPPSAAQGATGVEVRACCAVAEARATSLPPREILHIPIPA